MGTRRSRHNKGRKPLYKEHRDHWSNEFKLRSFASAAKAGTIYRRLTKKEKIARAIRRVSEEPADPVDLGYGPGALDLSRHLTYEQAKAPKATSDFSGITAEQILAKPKYMNNGWYSRKLRWEPDDLAKLKILCDASSDIEQVSVALGRPPTNVVHRARDTGLSVPTEWAKLISHYKRHPRQPNIVLQYPFIVKKRPEHADLMRANALVPHGYAPDVRADICQSVMLALFEGTVTLEELEKNKSSMRYFIGKFYKEQRPHQEISIEGMSADDDRSYPDMLVRLHDEYREDEKSELRRIASSYMDHQPATQVDDIYNQEMAATSSISHTNGLYLSSGEVRLLVEADDWHDNIGTFATLDKYNHAAERVLDRFGILLSHRDRCAISEHCRTAKPAWTSYKDFVHFVKLRGKRLCVIISGTTGDVKTVVPREWRPKWVS